MEKPVKRLIEKYDIPLNHLDFRYIAECKNAGEMEKIFHILLSGEEGYYAELTQCAEDRLRALKPNSRFLRKEDAMLGREALSKSELDPIHNWRNGIKATDQLLQDLQKHSTIEEQLSDLPAIRETGKIEIDQNSGGDSTSSKNKSNSSVEVNNNANTKSKDRIKSTDYNKWDKYNPDVEILRMDLAEEREREEAERQRNAIKQQCNQPKQQCLKITEITSNAFSKYSKVERQTLAEGYRLKGNDYFRAKEYEKAVAEYNLCIEMCPETAVTAYNNRAIANIKLKKFVEAIEDCESCLKVEPNNVKALLRLAEATSSYGRKRESYDIYLRILALEPSNAIAVKACNELKVVYGDVLPPANATRLLIEEPPKGADTSKKNPQPKAKAPVAKEYDLAALIKPDHVVPCKLAAAAENINKMAAMMPKKTEEKPTESENSEPEFQLRTSMQPIRKSGKPLIEEI